MKYIQYFIKEGKVIHNGRSDNLDEFRVGNVISPVQLTTGKIKWRIVKLEQVGSTILKVHIEDLGLEAKKAPEARPQTLEEKLKEHLKNDPIARAYERHRNRVDTFDLSKIIENYEGVTSVNLEVAPEDRYDGTE